MDDLLKGSNGEHERKHETFLDNETRVGSIINFATFLLLVFALKKEDTSEKEDTLEKEGKVSLDDRKLLETIWFQGFKEAGQRAKRFIQSLLYWRILFDNYIIKSIRENSDKTRWLIRPLKRVDRDSVNPVEDCDIVTKGTCNIIRDVDFDPEFRMLQALLHVSGCPKRLWLLPIMQKLSESRIFNEVKHELARIELNYRKERIDPKNIHSGVSAPRYALFALDYELWRKYNSDDRVKVADREYRPSRDFVFRFRDSVEHVYPRNPQTAQRWESKVLDNFGNLALISKPSNSSYNNQLPEDKRRDFAKDAEIESMKLLEIYRDDKFIKWGNDKGREHSKEMISILLNSFPDEPDYHDVRIGLSCNWTPDILKPARE